MSQTFICTSEKEWYLKITTIDQLLEYWRNVFDPKLQTAYETLNETKEFGTGYQHCDILQQLIGFTSKTEHITYVEAYEKIKYDHHIEQYQVLCEGKPIYITKNLGWNCLDHQTEQFVHKNNFDFPKMEQAKLEIKQFPMGKHFYVFIDGVQLHKDENVKFDSYADAENFAKQYLK